MSGSSSRNSFFSFGPDESYISKSFEGLRYRELPQALRQLILSGSVVDVHWAALGPVHESWVVSFRDGGGKNNIGWGSEIPIDLQDILTKLTPTPHLRVFLGPKDSFIAWDPSFIRWLGLPTRLEASLQSWLTPAGWKAGPPRIVTWGPKRAYFAISEYGEVAYQVRSGDAWPILRETVEEWEAEPHFSWSNIAYLSLDPTTADQFVAIRQDRTWAGSSDDSSEEALESFALNFFARTPPKSKAKTNGHGQSNGAPEPTETIPNAAAQAAYETWATEVASSFALALMANGGKAKGPKKLQIRNKSSQAAVPTVANGAMTGKLLSSFPYLPATIAICRLESCVTVKADPEGVRACKHDVERLLRASGLYSYEWLRQERIRWHPDRFGRLCEESWRETGRKLAEEMFKIIDSLISDLEQANTANGSV